MPPSPCREGQSLLQQVLGNHHALDLIGALVILGVLARQSTMSTEAGIVWRVVY